MTACAVTESQMGFVVESWELGGIHDNGIVHDISPSVKKYL